MWKNNANLSINSSDQPLEMTLEIIKPAPHFPTERNKIVEIQKQFHVVPFSLICNTCLKEVLNQVKESLN